MFEKEELKKALKEKKIKNLDDLNDFMREISKEILESLFDGEMTDFLGYEKYDHKSKETDNSRNGNSMKSVKSKFVSIGIDVPWDRKSDFEPAN